MEKYIETTELDEKEKGFATYVGSIGNNISIWDKHDQLELSKAEARKLMEVLINFFGYA